MKAHPSVEVGHGRIFANEEGLPQEKKAAVRAHGVKVKAGGELLLSQCEADQRLGEMPGPEDPETLVIPVHGPSEAGFARAAEELDHLLAGGIKENDSLATTADECQLAAGIALMKVGETQRERPSEFRRLAEEFAQLAFDLGTIEAFGELTGFNASSGVTGPLRDSSTAERSRLRRVCSRASSAVTRRWFFGGMAGK